MPTYRIQHPTTGKTIRIEGDTPPTDAELDQIFSEYGGEKKNALTGIRDQAPNINAAVAFAPGVFAKLGPLFAAGGTASGEVIKDLLTPRPKSDYTGKMKWGFKELNQQGKQRNLDTIGNALGKIARNTIMADLIQGIVGSKGSVSGKVTRPKETIMNYRNQQARLNPGPGIKKADLIKEIASKSDPLKETGGYLKTTNRLQSQLSDRYSQRPEYLSTQDLLEMKSAANKGSYLRNSPKSGATAEFDKVIGNILRGKISGNSKTVAMADKAYSLLSKAPKALNKAGTVATKAAATIGLLKLLGL